MFHAEGIKLIYSFWASQVVLGVRNQPASAGHIRDLGSIPGLRRSPGGGYGKPLQYSCLENPQGQRSLEGCSPWGCKESDTTEQLSTTYSTAQDL